MQPIDFKLLLAGLTK